MPRRTERDMTAREVVSRLYFDKPGFVDSLQGEIVTQAIQRYGDARAAEARELLRECEAHFAHGSDDDGVDLWRRISDALAAGREG